MIALFSTCPPKSQVQDIPLCPLPSYIVAMEELQMGNLKFQTYDLGGHTIARRLWREYYADVDGVVFLFDTTDRERFEESKAELDVR